MIRVTTLQSSEGTVVALMEETFQHRLARFAKQYKLPLEELFHLLADHEEVEKELRQREQQFRTQYKSLPLPTFTWRKERDDFVLIDYNDAAIPFTNGLAYQLLGRTAKQLYSPTMPELLNGFMRCYTGHTSFQQETTYRLQNFDDQKIVL